MIMKEIKDTIMKNIFSKTFLLAVTLSLAACFDLEKTDPNRQNEDTFWANQDQLEMARHE